MVDVDATRMSQARTASFQPELTRDHPLRVTTTFKWPLPAAGLAFDPGAVPAWEDSPVLKAEEFLRAEVLALFDYLRKSRSQGFVVSLSGGADSAAVTCLVALALEMALTELGEAGLRAKLGHVKNWPATVTARSLTAALLTTAYQATANSGPVTREAARMVASACGARHLELEVETIHQEYLRVITQAIHRPLDWKTDDLALQNIQARVRSPGIWLLANLSNSLLLSTSNRSEAAVGYATMDGDTSGGLSPIAGIDKAYLREWLGWLERVGPCGGHPIPVLAVINHQAPTAELRPATQHQTD